MSAAALKSDKYAALADIYRKESGSRWKRICSTPLPQLGTAELEVLRRENARMLTYFNRNISMVTEDASAPMNVECVSIALFDLKGVLLEYLWDGPFTQKLRQSGLREGTVWTLDTMGANAVTLGQQEKCSLYSSELEHTYPALQNTAIYYSHLELFKSANSVQAMDSCGIAVITDPENKNQDYRFLVSMLTYDLGMTIHCNEIVHTLFEKSGQGLLIVDKCIKPGQCIISYYNNKLFDLLHLQAFELQWHPLEELIFRQENEEFWRLIEKNQAVNDRELTLTVGGRQVPCIVTTEIFHQPRLGAGGVRFYIDTQELISKRISKRVGNGAVCTFDNIIGSHPSMTAAIHRGKLLARTDSNIMLLGESGVGKDVFAQCIHNSSSRRDKPFIAVNCGAIPRDLIASELFGYSSGAFTGAKKQGNVGKFELANHGTIFLDEIGELPIDMQTTLLRVVEQKQFMRLGSNTVVDVDVKIISATNVDISAMIRHKRFRADLYYRLSGMSLNLPPLRNRGQDIIRLAEHFIRRTMDRIGRHEPVVLTEESKSLLLQLPWPGNIRELQNTMECVVQLYQTPKIEPWQILENLNELDEINGSQEINLHSVRTAENQMPLPDPMPTDEIPEPSSNKAGDAAAASRPETIDSDADRDVRPGRKRTLTRQQILEALERSANNRSEAAKILGVSRKTLYRNMEWLGLD